MYSKQSQLKRNEPLKQKARKEPKYLSWLHEQYPRCFVCGKRNKIELHHIKNCSSDKKDDRYVIPLCGEEHHRSGTLSPHCGAKLWRATFSIGMQREYSENLYRKYEDETNRAL